MWKIHVLHHAASHDVWGLWLLDELADHGHQVSAGTLYPALARMEENGWLIRRKSGLHPRARQLYRITSDGRALLRALQREVTELYREIVLGKEPKSGANRRRKR
jgi:DNA-binding PadR family transcriptional regulator